MLSQGKFRCSTSPTPTIGMHEYSAPAIWHAPLLAFCLFCHACLSGFVWRLLKKFCLCLIVLPAEGEVRRGVGGVLRWLPQTPWLFLVREERRSRAAWWRRAHGEKRMPAATWRCVAQIFRRAPVVIFRHVPYHIQEEVLFTPSAPRHTRNMRTLVPCASRARRFAALRAPRTPAGKTKCKESIHETMSFQSARTGPSTPGKRTPARSQRRGEAQACLKALSRPPTIAVHVNARLFPPPRPLCLSFHAIARYGWDEMYSVVHNKMEMSHTR